MTDFPQANLQGNHFITDSLCIYMVYNKLHFLWKQIHSLSKTYPSEFLNLDFAIIKEHWYMTRKHCTVGVLKHARHPHFKWLRKKKKKKILATSSTPQPQECFQKSWSQDQRFRTHTGDCMYGMNLKTHVTLFSIYCGHKIFRKLQLWPWHWGQGHPGFKLVWDD